MPTYAPLSYENPSIEDGAFAQNGCSLHKMIVEISSKENIIQIQ
jgi:hypothetical protein